jgi:hypothetical protein
MKCADCNRPLLKFAVSIPTTDGTLRGWGPVCAKAHVIKAARTSTAAPAARRYRRAKPDVTQLALEFA